MRKTIFIFLFTQFLFNYNFSQITASYNSTESRCQSNGTITVNPSGGATPYLFEIIAGPVTRTQQLPNVFNGLPTGNYQIRITDNLSATVVIPATVAGNYTTPLINLNGLAGSCLNDGEIYASVSGGRGPFTYQLITPSPITTGPQVSDTFRNLSPGIYRVRVNDSCSNFSSQDFLINGSSNSVGFGNITALSYTCDSVTVRFSQPSAKLPFFSEFIDNITGDTLRFTERLYQTDTVTVPRSSSYRINFTDTCGNSQGVNRNLSWDPEVSFFATTYNCGYYSTTLNRFGDLRHGFVWSFYSIVSGPVIRPKQDTSYFDSLPPGTYTFEFCDSACDTCFNEVYTFNPVSVLSVTQGNYSCNDSTGRFMATFTASISNRIYNILVSPPSFTGPFTDTLLPYSVNITIYNLTAGFYSIEVKDTCGFTDTVSITISNLFYNNKQHLLTYCSGNSFLRVFGTINRGGTSYIYLRNLGSGAILHTETLINPTSYDFTVSNIPDGTYVIDYSSIYSCSAPLTVPSYARDTIVVLNNYTSPNIDYLIPFLCQDTNSGQIIVYASGGSRPYTYEIISGPVTRSAQTDSNFYLLPIGTYTVRVSDVCGNSTIQSTELAQYGRGNVTFTNPTCGLGNNFSALADTLPGATYQWTGPNSFLVNSRGFSLTPITINDTGTYYLNVVFGVCIDTIIPFRVLGDSIPPIANCKDSVIYLNASGTFTIDSSYINNGSVDSCGAITMNLSQNTFTCVDIGTNMIDLIVYDVIGNTDTCTATITVFDTIPPTAICQNINAYINSSGILIIDSSMVNNGSFDNCGIVSMNVIPNTFNCSNIGANNVTLIVIDASGNIDSCSSVVTILDTITSTTTCRDTTIYLNNFGNFTIDSSFVLTGGGGCNPITSATISQSLFSCSDIGINVINVLINGITSCTATVTVVDTINPTAICKNDTIYLNTNGSFTIDSSYVNNNSTDNCTITSMTVSPNSFTCNNIGVNNVTLYVNDQSGNTDSCMATITVFDSTSPLINCPQDIYDTLTDNCNYLIPDFTNTNSTDNCTQNNISLSQTPLPGTIISINKGSSSNTSVVITASDTLGNTSNCSFNINLRCVTEFEIPQFFSPNGDNKNDVWFIKGIDSYPDNNVKIFNRYGVLVYSKIQYNNTWDGKPNNENAVGISNNTNPLPAGTYFYIVKLGEELDTHTGFVQLKM